MTTPVQPTSPVRIALHIGVHFTANSYMPEALAKNGPLLSEAGIHTPHIRHSRGVILHMLKKLDGLPPIQSEEDEVLAQLLARTPARKLLMSDDRWASPFREAFSGDHLYARIGESMGPVTELFASSDLQLSLSLINPAVFLHQSLSTDTAKRLILQFVDRVDPATLSWRDTIATLRKAAPDVPLTIWCEEDAPLMWPRALRHLLGLPEGATITGGLEPLKPLLDAEGFARLETYVEKHPPETDAQYEQVITLFLDKYGDPDALAPRCEIPDWGDAEIAAVTQTYEDDLVALSQEDGIRVLSPSLD